MSIAVRTVLYTNKGLQVLSDRALTLRPRLSRTRSNFETYNMAGESPRKGYTLYTAGTPNGWKPSITLEELGIPYDVRKISLSDNEQKQDWFLKINPNGRIPALVDHTCGDVPIFESGAIMWWLASRDPEAKLFPKDPIKQAEVMSWLMFQMGGVGPMQGQANHFLRYAPVKIEYGINRYVNETNRLYQVLEDQLKDHEWLAAEQYTIADIANFTWVYIHSWSGASLDDKPNLKAWLDKIAARPAVQRGLDVPEKNKFKSMTKEEEEKAIAEAQKFMGSTSAPGAQK